MGSRYLPGGAYGGEMPFYRKFATRLHPFLVGLLSGRKITESTNGYRAMKVSVLSDTRINLHQAWLDQYELEVYLLMKLLRLGYKCTEVPVSKFYPPRRIGNTKMRPVLDWWKMIKPILLLGFSLRH
jgi:dolichol-phosphate mannosyltransferase